MAMNTFIVLEIFHLFFVRNIHGTSLTWAAVRGTGVVWLAVIAIAEVHQVSNQLSCF